MDRQLAPSEKRPQAFRKIIWVMGILLLLVLAFLLLRNLLTKKIDLDDMIIAQVERGLVENRVTASGTVIPSYERAINAPVSTEINEVYLEAGAQVKKGDLIMELDNEYTKLEYDQIRDQLEVRKNNIYKLKLSYDKDLRELEYNSEIKKLQVAQLEAELKDQKRLHEVGGSTLEEVQAAELALQVSQIEEKVINNDLDYKTRVNDSEKQNLELEYKIQEKKLAELSRKLKETKVIAESDGVLTWINEDLGKKLNEGDLIVKLANLEKFKIEATSPDRYAAQIRLGAEAIVRINKKEVQATITNVSPSIENNTVRFNVRINNATEINLRPNMRVDVFIVSGRKENVLRIKNGPALKGAKKQYLFSLQGDEAIRKEVTIGLRNPEYVELSGDIKVGERIILSDMEDFKETPSIKLVK